jgi:hypothetical protein
VNRITATANIPLKRHGRFGFSLVEVNLAIMVVGLGMLVLFGLFPAGLREGENALINTHCALFADAVFNSLRSEATTKNWTGWKGWAGASFGTQIRTDSGLVPIRGRLVGQGTVQSVQYPTSEETIYYVMEVSGNPADMERRVWLWVKSAKHATDKPSTFKEESLRFRCGFFYSSGENQ